MLSGDGQSWVSLTDCAAWLSLLGRRTPLSAVGALSVPLVRRGRRQPSAQISDDSRSRSSPTATWRPHPALRRSLGAGRVPPDWRPYQYGHWVYTDEWGWYWVSDDAEADWGWVIYHYGRWAFERGLGWFWVPGDEWAPAWVDWRYGDEYVGWAPLPPDELIETYEANPPTGCSCQRVSSARRACGLTSCRRLGASAFCAGDSCVNRTVRCARTVGGQSRHLACVRRARERRAGGRPIACVRASSPPRKA